MQPQQYWRESPQRYRLEAGQCRKCKKIYFPPRRLCPACHQQAMTMVPLPREGKLVTYTMLHIGTEQFSKLVPYAIAVVELKNGVRVTAQMADVDAEDLKIGLPVRLEFRKIRVEGHAGVIGYGYKAVPA